MCEGVRRQEFIFVNSGLNHTFHPTGKYPMFSQNAMFTVLIYEDIHTFDAFSFDEHLNKQ